MKIVDSTDGVIYCNKRRTGNTTRVADNVIQQLFNGHKVRILEYSGDTFQHLRRLRRIVLERLKAEHNIGTDLIDVIEDRGSCFISLKDRDG